MIVGTNMMSIFHHRVELIERLYDFHHSVYVVSPIGDDVIKETEELENKGVKIINLSLENRGSNILSDFKYLKNLIRTFKDIKPDIILTFYTKTNIYGGIAARITGIPYITNITGLGTEVVKTGFIGNLMRCLYKTSIKKANIVFFQNQHDVDFFKNHNIKTIKQKLLPGSGVNLKKNKLLPYPSSEDEINFVFISRVMKEKGLYEYIEAAKAIKERYPRINFDIVGPVDDLEIEKEIENASNNEIIRYRGKIFDVREFLMNAHCMVLPSYYPEGMANVLLESASCGRPIITTENQGCSDTINDGESGLLIKKKDPKDLEQKIETFINMPHNSKVEMGKAGRRKMEKEFDREIVINSYIDEINSILEKNPSN